MVSGDTGSNPSGFKTLKYQPDFPGRFRDAEHARSWMREFTPWYNEQHRHEGLNGFTPNEVYSGPRRALGRASSHPGRRLRAPSRALDQQATAAAEAADHRHDKSSTATTIRRTTRTAKRSRPRRIQRRQLHQLTQNQPYIDF